MEWDLGPNSRTVAAISQPNLPPPLTPNPPPLPKKAAARYATKKCAPSSLLVLPLKFPPEKRGNQETLRTWTGMRDVVVPMSMFFPRPPTCPQMLWRSSASWLSPAFNRFPIFIASVKDFRVPKAFCARIWQPSAANCPRTMQCCAKSPKKGALVTQGSCKWHWHGQDSRLQSSTTSLHKSDGHQECGKTCLALAAKIFCS